LVALIFLFAQFGGPSAEAMGLCDCCSRAALTPDCQSACAGARQEILMCRPVVIYDGDAGEPPRGNALAVGSLKHLSMGRPDRSALERFRQWFELWRSRGEAKFKAALARYETGEGSDAEFARAEAERDQVLVNYQHGMQRYSEILRPGRHKRVKMGLATAQPAKTAVPASGCIRNWVNAPCVVAEVKSAPAVTRLVVRREVYRSKRVSEQKIVQQKVARQKVVQQKVARQKVVEQKVVQQKVVQQKVVQQKLVRVAVRTAKVCTGNWVNAACAAP
jgi:hypothetical protein